MTDFKNKIKALAERNRLATTDEERAAVVAEMDALKNENEQAFMVSMAYIAKTYFKKSRSWLAHKLNGNIVNGKPSQFTEEELKTLRFALNDMSNKLNYMSIAL